MPTNNDPLAAYTIGTTLLQCVQDRLASAWVDFPTLSPDPAVPNRSCVIAGAIAWDDCECGQLIVSISSQWGSLQFAQPVTNGQHQRCGPPIHVIEYIVSLLRCSPTGSGDEPPTCAELDATARTSTIDAWAMNAGLMCCLIDMRTRSNGVKEIEHFNLSQQPMEGSDGLCQGVSNRVLVGINNGCPCNEEVGSS